MERLKAILAQLKELSAEELAELKAHINEEETATEEVKTEENAKTEEETAEDTSVEKAEETEEVIKPEATEEAKEEEIANAEETADTTEKPTAEEVATEEEVTTEEEIPVMSKVDTAVDEEAPVVADDGEELAVDYEQVIDGLNAKIAALQAENATLKSKVDGAFGYSAKTAVPARTNRLYDEATDLHFTK